MARIDSHQHFWQFNPVRDSWIDDSMKVIQRDFMPGDLKPLLDENGFDGCVTVQSDQSEAENEFQLANAAKNDFIRGVVGWVDLRSPGVEERLAYYHQFEKMKGFRHVLQGEADRAFMLQPSFMQGIGLLQRYGYTYDILIFPDQLRYCVELAKAFPSQPFVLDHIAKPYIKDRNILEWQRDIKALAKCDNVYCKLSGMITEADWQRWTVDDLKPCIDTVVEAFGVDRLMYGSDWPVCLVAGSYKKVAGIIKEYFSGYAETEQELIFGGNATRFYHLK